jgi:hypothetical protein
MATDKMYTVQAKLRQARRHLDALNQAIKDFFDNCPVRIEEHRSDDQMEYVFTVHNVNPVPEEISLLAGDVLHNCRATLDHLAWAITHRGSKQTRFPILLTAPAGGPQISGGISPAHQAALLAAQPYKVYPQTPKNALLAILGELDNIDKHKLLITSVSVMEGNRHGNPRGHRGDAPVGEYHWGPLKEGDAVAIFRCSEPSPNVTVLGFEIFPTVALIDIGIGKDELNANELLWRIHEHVRDVVLTFDPL